MIGYSPSFDCLRTGSGAWACRQRGWLRGMRLVDCLGESRMRENLMSGLGRGSRKRGLRYRACFPLHRLAVSSGNGRGRSPASSIPFGGVCNRAVRNVK